VGRSCRRGTTCFVGVRFQRGIGSLEPQMPRSFYSMPAASFASKTVRVWSHQEPPSQTNTAPRIAYLVAEKVLIHYKLPAIKYQPRWLQPLHMATSPRAKSIRIQAQHQSVSQHTFPNKYKSIMSNDPPSLPFATGARRTSNKTPANLGIAHEAEVQSWVV